MGLLLGKAGATLEKMLLRLAFLFVMVFLKSGAFGCVFPECDIAAELRMLEAKGQSFRFQYVSKLKSVYAKDKSGKILLPLLNLARSVVSLIEKLNDEDYVLREAKGLRDQTLFLLVQWVWRDCNDLGKAYSELTSETQRYAALDFFLRRVHEFKEENTIRSLVCFAGSAEAISRKSNDAEYVPRHANSLASALSSQLLEVVSGWEGVFKLLSIDGPLAEEIDELNLMIFSTSGELGIVAALSHPILRPMIFQNISFTGKPQHLTSRQSLGTQVPSVIDLQFDEEFETVRGTILEPIELRKVNFSAVRVQKVNSISENPCLESDIPGQYETTLAGYSGIFSVKLIGPSQYAAVFSSAAGELRLPFAYGRYNPGVGRLTFVNTQANAPLGWRLLAHYGSEKKCTLSGWGLSAFNGRSYPISLNRKAQ